MIKIKKNLKAFLQIMNIIKVTTIDVILSFDKEFLSIKFVHPSNFAMGLIKLKKGFFDEYNIDKVCNVTIDTTEFYKIIKNISEQEINISVEKENTIIKVSSKNSFFSLKTYVVPENDKTMPSPEYKSKWIIDTSDFFTLVNNHLEFNNVVCFSSEGDTLKTLMKSTLVNGEIMVNAKNKLKQDTKCYYDIELLSIILDIKTFIPEVEFSFGSDTPCGIKINNDELELEWILAPRVEDE